MREVALSTSTSSETCPHCESCAAFALFERSNTLGLWKISYCEGEFTNCARYQRSCEGELVPHNLLPNGAELPVF